MIQDHAKGGEKRIRWAIVLFVCLLVAGSLCLAACAPQQETSNEAQAQAESEADDQAMVSDVAVMADFTERSTGDFEAFNESDAYINAGNRGCNACHADLWETVKNTTPTHIVTNHGYGKNGNILECLSCHSAQVGRGGVYLGDIVHSIHYSDDMFVDGNGNCWSCHATLSEKTGANVYREGGETEMVLFEQLKYTEALGGYLEGNDAHTRDWVAVRGWEGGYLSGVTVDASLDAEITMDQEPSAEEDIYIVENFGPTEDMADWDNWALEIIGTNEPRSFTLDELKALPQVEITATQVCSVNGQNGGLVSNIPMKGVLLKDVIEAAGGLPEGAEQMYPQAIDGWTGEAYAGISVQKMLDLGAIIATEYYGHDLTFGEGYPATIVVPGYGGSTWCKTLQSIEFKQEPAFDPMPSYATNGFGWTVNSAWFDNDGVEGKVGEPMTLDGFTWSWAGLHGNTKSISFSADYGVTWQTFDVPEDFDPNQWAHWNFTWTPDEAGTYVLHVKATAEDGTEQMGNASVVVKVTE